jgi:hypothetical protein
MTAYYNTANSLRQLGIGIRQLLVQRVKIFVRCLECGSQRVAVTLKCSQRSGEFANRGKRWICVKSDLNQVERFSQIVMNRSRYCQTFRLGVGVDHLVPEQSGKHAEFRNQGVENREGVFRKPELEPDRVARTYMLQRWQHFPRHIFQACLDLSLNAANHALNLIRFALLIPLPLLLGLVGAYPHCHQDGCDGTNGLHPGRQVEVSAGQQYIRSQEYEHAGEAKKVQQHESFEMGRKCFHLGIVA